MRIIGLWGVLFSLLLIVVTGFMSYARRQASTDNYWAIFSTDTLDLYRLAPNGKITNLTHTPETYEYLINASPDGKWLLAASFGMDDYSPKKVYLLSRTTTRLELLIENFEGENEDFSWSPDSKWLAYTPYPRQIILINPQGEQRVLSPLRQCTTQSANEIAQEIEPHWSPDGQWIYFVRHFCDGSLALYRMHPDGTARQLVLADYQTTLWWSSDGEWIIFYGDYNEFMLYRMRPDGSQRQSLNKKFYGLVGVTDWIYLRLDDGLYRMKMDGTGFEQITTDLPFGGKEFSQFTANWLYFVKGQVNDGHIYRLNMLTLQMENLTSNFINAHPLGISPDEQWIFFNANTFNNKTFYSYRMKTDGSQLKKLNLFINNRQPLLWLSMSNLPWHAERLAFGAVGLSIIGFILRRRTTR